MVKRYDSLKKSYICNILDQNCFTHKVWRFFILVRKNIESGKRLVVFYYLELGEYFSDAPDILTNIRLLFDKSLLIPTVALIHKPIIESDDSTQ